MTPHDDGHGLALGSVDVGPARAARIRRRAHAALARARPRQARGERHAAGWLEPAMVASVSAAFLVEVVRRAAWLWTP